jgi:hypothetical protein
MTRAEMFEAHVAAAVDVPAEWGRSDCSAWVAEWVGLVTGREIVLPPYASEAAAAAIVAENGGIEAIWRFYAAELALAEIDVATTVPELGDIGLIMTETVGPAGGIWGEYGAFAWRAHGGVRLMTPRRNDVLASWRVP